MKTLIIVLATLFFGEMEKPATIPSKITELKSNSWYTEKAEEWKVYLAANESDHSSWLQYLLATKYAGKMEKAQLIQDQILEKFPNSFAAHYSAFQVEGWSDAGIEELQSALSIDDSQEVSFEDQLIYAELIGENRSEFSKKIFEEGLIHSSTLNYCYNLLMSVNEGGLLILDGIHTTTPIWVLQDVMNVREDVSILNLELARYQEEYLDRILSKNNMNRTVEELLNEEQGQNIYYALTLPRTSLQKLENRLYVVGLASTSGSEGFQHFETLRENVEEKFLMDYLTLDFNGEPKTATGKVLSTNYIVSLLLLKEFYEELNNADRSEELKQQIQLLAKGSQMETRVELLLNKTEAPRAFKVVEIDVKELEKMMKPIRGNLYASEQELSNKEYWFFMEYLRTNGYDDLYNKFLQDLSRYEDEITKSMMSRYHYSPVNWKELESKAKKHNILSYPAMDFKYEAAKAYCEWMTVQYNANEKREFEKVLFRLPTKDEWIMSALGYKDFQSWNLEDNIIEARLRGPKSSAKQFDLSKNEIKYPWGIDFWERRNTIENEYECYLANVDIGEKITCKAGMKGDGFSFTSPVKTYFGNKMGLYDVIGNVAEMINEPGIAMGGSWNHKPDNATITSSDKYEESDSKVGMRLFMEVIEE